MFAVVELEKKEFFIGEDSGEALFTASEKYPSSRFVTIRIGFDAAYTTGASLKPISL